MGESQQHIFAKNFIAALFRHAGYAAQVEKKMYRQVTTMDANNGPVSISTQLMKWTFDVAAVGFVFPANYENHDSDVVRKIDVEIDRYESGGGHGKGRQVRDRQRDDFFKVEGFEIFRFPLSYFNRRKLDKDMEKRFKKELGLVL